MSRYSPSEYFSVLIGIILVNGVMLGFICPFENYQTVFLILSLISITPSLLEAKSLQISFN